MADHLVTEDGGGLLSRHPGRSPSASEGFVHCLQILTLTSSDFEWNLCYIGSAQVCTHSFVSRTKNSESGKTRAISCDSCPCLSHIGQEEKTMTFPARSFQCGLCYFRPCGSEPGSLTPKEYSSSRLLLLKLARVNSNDFRGKKKTLSNYMRKCSWKDRD